MSTTTARTDRARLLAKRATMAVSASASSGVLAGLFWMLAVVNYADTPLGEHPSSTVLVFAVLGVAATSVCAAYAAAAFVVGAMRDTETAG